MNRLTASELAKAFVAFERDNLACVAVLTGAGSSFCAGADLAALSKVESGHSSEANQLVAVGAVEQERSGAALDTSGPMGITRMLLSKPVIAAISGFCVAGGLVRRMSAAIALALTSFRNLHVGPIIESQILLRSLEYFVAALASP